MILFGWYTFLIRAYTFEQLGIRIEGIDPSQQIEVRQRCFHLFWIPFFGLGKIYAIRKDGQLYNLTPELEDALRENSDHRTPWYTFIGPILILVGFILYLANEKYENYEREKARTEFAASKYEIASNPIVGDQYTIYTDKLPNTFYARVSEIRSDSVLLKIIQLRKREWGDGEPERISFDDEDLKFAPQWTTSAEILNATPIDSYKCKDSLQLYIPEFGGITSFKVAGIERNGKKYN